MASVSILSSSSAVFSSRHAPSASLTFLTGSRTSPVPAAVTFRSPAASARPAILSCSFCPAPFSSMSLASSFAGSSLGFGFYSSTGARSEKRRGLVVRAGKPALCQTKRNRSRKSLARTHGFRRRMRTTSGRAILKRRRAKGRWVLCPKSYPNSGVGS